MDDCLSDNSWQKDSQIKEIFMNGHHYDLILDKDQIIMQISIVVCIILSAIDQLQVQGT